MREKKWPAGPWWWDEDFPADGMSFEAPALDAYFQEHAPWLVSGDGETAVLKGEVMTTPDIARLIAAAPELVSSLEALRDAVQQFIEDEVCDHAVGICYCGAHEVLADADEALAKAYGES